MDPTHSPEKRWGSRVSRAEKKRNRLEQQYLAVSAQVRGALDAALEAFGETTTIRHHDESGPEDLAFYGDVDYLATFHRIDVDIESIEDRAEVEYLLLKDEKSESTYRLIVSYMYEINDSLDTTVEYVLMDDGTFTMNNGRSVSSENGVPHLRAEQFGVIIEEPQTLPRTHVYGDQTEEELLDGMTIVASDILDIVGSLSDLNRVTLFEE